MDGSEVRDARSELGMTQAEFGVALGVARVTVCRWEKGKRKVVPRTVKGINNLLALHRARQINQKGEV